MKNIYIIQDDNIRVLFGTLLGDAYFPKLAFKQQNRKIAWEHTDKQRDYAIWKARRIGFQWNKYERKRLDKRTNKTYKSITIVLRANESFNKIYKIFCPKSKKIVTNDILSYLSKEAVAIWYCDDGNLYQNKDTNHLTLSIQSFKNKQLIIDFFKRKFSVNFKLNDGAIRLVNKNEIRKFIDSIKPYVPIMMQYKIDFVDYKTYKGRYYGKDR
jgi:hypothetical protein